jgi:hypothetical protein
MNFHIRDEVLSAYLDGEIEPARERNIEDHLTSCTDCRARLAGLRSVVLELRRAPRLQPPPVLEHRVRQQAMEQTPPGVLESLRALFGGLGGLPLQPAMRTVMAMGLALALSLSLAGIEREQRLGLLGPPVEVEQADEPVPDVEVKEGASLADVRWPTTSQVGGVEFRLNDDGVWVQKGLEGSKPETRFDSLSPEGRAMLTMLSDLDLLLSDGHRVVLRYEDGTVELSSSPGQRPAARGGEPSPLRGASLGWPSARV